MKKYFLLIIAIFACSFGVFAQKQDKAKMMEDIQKFKIDFLAQEMNLSEKTKSEFAPLYKEYDDQLRSTGKEVFKFERELKKKKDASEADYKKLADLKKKSREDFDAVNKKFEPKFEEILSAKQLYQMHEAEAKFYDKMKQMRKKHGDRPHKGNRKDLNKRGDRPDIPGDVPPPPEF